MAQREGDRKQIIKELTDAVTMAVFAMEDGGEATIAELAGAWYKSCGYEFMHVDIDHGYVWTKDGGATYSIEEDDLFDVQERVIKRLKGKRVLDFSAHDGLVEGLPYNLSFKIRKAE